MTFSKNLVANIYYKASNSLTIILFTLLAQDPENILKEYFLSIAIAAYITTLLIVNILQDKDVGNKSHKYLINNLSNSSFIAFILALIFNETFLIQASIALTVILKTISDSYVARKNRIFKRVFTLFLYDILKIPLFIFGSTINDSLLLMSLLFLSSCPDIKINRFRAIKLRYDKFLTRNLFSLTKNLESITIYLLISSNIVPGSLMVYFQQAVSAINVFLITKWQSKIHKKNNYIREYVKEASSFIFLIGCLLGLIAIITNQQEIYILGSLIVMRTIIIDPIIFMTNNYIRKVVATIYTGIFFSGLIAISTGIIILYYIATLFLIFLMVRKIISGHSNNSI